MLRISKCKRSTKQNCHKKSYKASNLVELYKVFTAEELEYRSEFCPKCKSF